MGIRAAKSAARQSCRRSCAVPTDGTLKLKVGPAAGGRCGPHFVAASPLPISHSGSSSCALPFSISINFTSWTKGPVLVTLTMWDPCLIGDTSFLVAFDTGFAIQPSPGDVEVHRWNGFLPD